MFIDDLTHVWNDEGLDVGVTVDLLLLHQPEAHFLLTLWALAVVCTVVCVRVRFLPWKVSELLQTWYKATYVESLAPCLTHCNPRLTSLWVNSGSHGSRLRGGWALSPKVGTSGRRGSKTIKRVSNTWNKCHAATRKTPATSTRSRRLASHSASGLPWGRQTLNETSKLIRYWKAHGPVFLLIWRPF